MARSTAISAVISSLFTVCGLAACGPDEPVDLIDPALWALVSPDPLDPSVQCGADGLLFEEGLVEIDTTRCGHVTVSQPSLDRVRKGDDLDLFAFHSALSAPEPAVGRMTLWIDEVLVWQVTPDIPSAEGVYIETVQAPARAPKGSTVQLHVSNHGGNSWRFVSLERL